MTFTIIRADSAEIELDKIFEYYSENASRQIAINILQKIISGSDKLLIDPETYPLEEATVRTHLSRLYNYSFLGIASRLCALA